MLLLTSTAEPGSDRKLAWRFAQAQLFAPRTIFDIVPTLAGVGFVLLLSASIWPMLGVL